MSVPGALSPPNPVNTAIKRLRFLTAMPQDVRKSSGCYVAIRTLQQGLEAHGVAIDLSLSRIHLPVFAAERLIYNHSLKADGPWDATVGFDLDGYAIAARSRKPHIAAIKGVLADAVPYERRFTHASMALQAYLEKLHARRADLIVTISRYCADRIADLYGVRDRVVVVPELIDLAVWNGLFQANAAEPDPNALTVLCVCRFYARKRVALLIRAAALLRRELPELRVRIVGNGPQSSQLQRLAQELGVADCVTLVGDVSRSGLAREYNRADIFCLPSVQEGFGIVFLEAMAAGKPIVAVRAAAAPEVARIAFFAEPESAESLADCLLHLGRDESLRNRLGRQGKLDVERFDVSRVSAEFLSAVQLVA